MALFFFPAEVAAFLMIKIRTEIFKIGEQKYDGGHTPAHIAFCDFINKLNFKSAYLNVYEPIQQSHYHLSQQL